MDAGGKMTEQQQANNNKSSQPSTNGAYTGIGAAAIIAQNQEEDKRQGDEGSNEDQDRDMDDQGSGDMEENEGSSSSSEEDQKINTNTQMTPAFGTVTRSGGGAKRTAPKIGKRPGVQRKKQFGMKKQTEVAADLISQSNDDLISQQYETEKFFQNQHPKQYNYVKQRFLYKPFMPLPNLQDYLQEMIEIRVYREYLTKFNKAYIKRNFYGQDIYTSDSDAVCILAHVGHFKVGDEEPSDIEAISVYFRVVKGRNNYQSTQRYGIRSRKMAQFDGHSIKYEGNDLLKSLGSMRELLQMTQAMPTHLEPIDMHQQKKSNLKMRIACSKMPDPAYKAINPAIIFNLSLEPAFLFNLATFADRNDDLVGRTCHKLQDSVLYIETEKFRFEICKQAGNIQEIGGLKYRFSQVVDPFLKDNSFFANERRPLNDQYIKVIAKDLDWSDFQWGENSLVVKDIRYETLKNYKYYPIK